MDGIPWDESDDGDYIGESNCQSEKTRLQLNKTSLNKVAGRVWVDIFQ